MEKRNPKVDEYIEKSAEFARPILLKLRGLIHEACPEAEEKIKWSFPHFDYLGEMMCSMAAFKEHCTFGFWKASLLKERMPGLNAQTEKAMGQFGRIERPEDLPPDKVLLDLIREAARLNKEKIKLPRPKTNQRKELTIPSDFAAALRANDSARVIFDRFSYSQRKEYLEWIEEAKSENTRQRRLSTAIEWISEGKPRHWKYIRKSVPVSAGAD